MQILLTGATGFLGNNILRMLLDDGHAVTVTNRHSSDPRPLDGLRVETVQIDLTDPAAVSAAVQGMDLVIHSAAIIHLGWTRLAECRKFNVGSTRSLAQAARRQGIRMIHVSTVDTLAPAKVDQTFNETNLEPAKPACSYVVSKRESETAFLAEVDGGLDGLIVNPGFMVGPWDWKPSSGQMMMAVAKGAGLLAPRGGLSAVDVRDAAGGILSAIEHGRTGERYILGGESMTYRKLWSEMADVVGRRAPITTTPEWINWTAGRVGDLTGKLMGKEPIVNSASTAMGSLYHWYSSEKAERELGYQNGPVKEALRDAWEWFQQHGYVRRTD